MWLSLVSFGTGLVTVWLVGKGLVDRRRRAADILEKAGPQGSAASRVRHDAFATSIEFGPPPWDRAACLQWAHSEEAKKSHKQMATAKAEAMQHTARALEYSDAQERELRAADLRSGAWRDVVAAGLAIVAAVAPVVAVLTA